MRWTALFAAAIFLALICTPVWSDSAYAQKRIALVVGNSAYTPALPNPTMDAQAVAAKFKDAGYDVKVKYDLGYLDFKRALRDFEDAAADADITVVFYAGHGVEIGGNNYVIPVDAKLASTRDAPDEAIPLERLLDAVDGAKKLSLVILDACRDNPFGVRTKRARTSALRSLNAGLSPVEPTNSNTLIAFATKTGTAAEDGTAGHSPFSAALLNHLFVPGLDVRLAFGRVRDEVLKKTGNRQEPYVTGSIGGESLALVDAPAQPKLATLDPDGEEVKSDYQLAEQIGTERAWQVFLNQHPEGYYAELAHAQVAKLASLKPQIPGAPEPTSEEQRVWDRIKDSGNAAWLRDFIKRYPTSPLANTAQTRLDAIEREVREREEKARQEREAKAAEAARQKAELEAARKRAEEERQAKAAEAARLRAEREAAAKREAEERLAKLAAEEARKKAEREAARKREEEERQAKAAEAARLKVEREAALKREEEERRAKAAAEAERQRIEREAALKRQEEERQAKAAEAARLRAQREAVLEREEEEQRAKAATEAGKLTVEREAALKRAEEERQAKAAQAARQKAEREATLKQAEEERAAKATAEAERQRIEREAALKRHEEERQAKTAEAARLKAEREAALKRVGEERAAKAAAKAERQKIEREAALKRAEEERAAKAAEAERLKVEREAALRHAEEERKAKIELVRQAQTELARIGCYSSTLDGELGPGTRNAIKQYQTRRGQPVSNIDITDGFVSELRVQLARICPLSCPPGKVAEGEHCVAAQPPGIVPAPVVRQNVEPEEKPRRERAKKEEPRTRPVAHQRDNDERPSRRERASLGDGGDQAAAV
jgi:Caspase domain/Putative peptidoglycan binding domain